MANGEKLMCVERLTRPECCAAAAAAGRARPRPRLGAARPLHTQKAGALAHYCVRAMLMKAAHHGARLLALATGGLLCTVLLIPSISGDPSVTIASFHPFLMTLAFVILMSLGVTSYVSDFGGKVRVAGGQRR